MNIYHVINFIVLIVFLFFVLRKKLNSVFATQRQELEANMNAAKAEEERIRADYEEIKLKVDTLEQKLKELKEASMRSIEFESKRLEVEAKEQIEKISNEAQKKIAQEKERISKTFKADVIHEATKRAISTLSKEMVLQDEPWTTQMIEGAESATGKKNYGS